MMLYVLSIAVLCVVLNIPFGIWRARTRKFSIQWWLAIHLPVPAIIVARIVSQVSPWWIPLFIACAVIGQIIGGRINPPARPPAA